MAALNFTPDSPSNGDTFTANGVTYTYDGTKWKTSIVSNDFFPNTGGTVSGNIVLDGELQHSGDTDTKLHFDTDTIKLDTAGSERFRVGSAGQLGIGGATYGTDGQVLTSGGASAAPSWTTLTTGEILQVVTTTKTDAASFTSSSSSFSGNIMSVNITPASTNSRILVLFNGNFGAGLSQRIFIRLVESSSAINAATGDSVGNRVRATTASGIYGSTNFMSPMSFHYVHSPSSTSQLTYSMQMGREGNGTVWLNRSEADTDNNTIQRGASMLTAIEIAS